MKDMERLVDDIKRHEGVRLEVYLDTEGLPTVGVGHLIRPEDNLVEGDTITEEQCQAFLEADLQSAVSECQKMFANFDDMGEDLQLILANMMFNLGSGRLAGFRKFRAALDEGDYQRAADEMVDSRWYRQVKSRGVELVERMRALA